MRTSNTSTAVAALVAIGMTWPAAADDLSLVGGGQRLSGTVLSITGDGVVELASDLSPEPLLLKAGAVEKVTFSARSSANEPTSTIIELVNGDLLPATIENLDEQRLIVVSPDVGRLEIPRASVKSMQFGIQRRKVIYEGPRSLEEWTNNADETKNWVFENQSLVSKGPSTASKVLPLSRQFILRFQLEWQAGSIPNFLVSFADPLAAKGEPSDRYYLQFGGAGLEIKREATKGKRYNTIAILNRPVDQYPDNRLQVEIRVNRDNARLQLFLNGEPEGEFADPIADIPTGSGILLTFHTPNAGAQNIRNIEVLEFDDTRRRHRAEDRGDPQSDSLISREDDRWSGRLLGIRNTAEGALLRFKTGFQEDPIEIPEADVSTVFLAENDAASVDLVAHPFVLRLPGDGALRVSSCRFSGDSASADHPLLGSLTFRRGGITAMERVPTVPKP